MAPEKEVAHMEMNDGAVLKARLLDEERQDKKISYWINADLCTYLSLWDHLERGAEMKSSVIWQSRLISNIDKNGGIHKKDQSCIISQHYQSSISK